MENITFLYVERIDGSFVFILRNKQQIYLNIANIKGKYNHLFYYEMQMEAHVLLNDFDINSVKSHCLLLQMLNPNGLPTKSDVFTISSIYTTISDD